MKANQKRRAEVTAIAPAQDPVPLEQGCRYAKIVKPTLVQLFEVFTYWRVDK